MCEKMRYGRDAPDLLRRRPELDVRIREGPRPRLLESLREGEIDVALIVCGPTSSVEDGIDVEPVLTSEIDLLAPRGVLPAGRRSVALRSLDSAYPVYRGKTTWLTGHGSAVGHGRSDGLM